MVYFQIPSCYIPEGDHKYGYLERCISKQIKSFDKSFDLVVLQIPILYTHHLLFFLFYFLYNLLI